jgi:hypothetical protein
MIESYTLLSHVLVALKEEQVLPEWFQTFARRFAHDTRYFLSLDSDIPGSVLSDNNKKFSADIGVSHYVGAVVRNVE